MKKIQDEELWITNTSRTQDISIADLCLRIKIGKSINLLSKRKNGRLFYNLTRKQIDDSIKSGSIFKKSDIVKIRKVPPVILNTRLDLVNTGSLRTKSSRLQRKPMEIEIPDYPDLDFEDGSEEDFAAENADLDFADRAPTLVVDPKFKKDSDSDE